jgi:hypothetical protein
MLAAVSALVSYLAHFDGITMNRNSESMSWDTGA